MSQSRRPPATNVQTLFLLLPRRCRNKAQGTQSGLFFKENFISKDTSDTLGLFCRLNCKHGRRSDAVYLWAQSPAVQTPAGRPASLAVEATVRAVGGPGRPGEAAPPHNPPSPHPERGRDGRAQRWPGRGDISHVGRRRAWSTRVTDSSGRVRSMGTPVL